MELCMKNRVYFVTGGSRGIGRALVDALLEEGARVGVCARSAEGLAALRDGLPPERRACLCLHACDVRDAGAVRAAVEETAARFGGLDGVAANAGYGSSGGVLDTEAADWSAQYELKLAGALNPVRAALPLLRQSSAGRVLVLNGVTANRPEGDMAAVSAARAALRPLVRLLAEELAPAGICVNALNLGVIDTGRQRERHRRSASPLPYEGWMAAESARRGIPMGRYGRPEEVVPAALLLLSPLASYITAAALDVSGGLATTL